MAAMVADPTTPKDFSLLTVPLTRSCLQICQGRGSHMALIAVAATLLLIFATLVAFTQSSRNAIGVSIRSRNQSIPGPAAAQGRARCVRAYASGNPKHIIISGAPASGKGTQCQLIVDKYGVKHISTGDALRAHVRSQTELGKKAKAYMDAGDLVPDELIMSIMKEEAMHGSSGWLLDGVPRTAKQVEALRETGLIPDKVILLEVPDEVLIERCVGRLFDPETGNTYHRKYFPPPPEIAERCVQR
eukprot:1390433-Amorphochlora_amoeboformis.AAC.2